MILEWQSHFLTQHSSLKRKRVMIYKEDISVARSPPIQEDITGEMVDYISFGNLNWQKFSLYSG